MADILDISKRKARDIHLESDLGHLMENCFVQSSLSKLQETIVLRVLRVPHVLLCHCMAQSTEMVAPSVVGCATIAATVSANVIPTFHLSWIWYNSCI